MPRKRANNSGFPGEGSAPPGLDDALRLVCITPPAPLAPDRFELSVREAVDGGATAVMLRHPGLNAAELTARGRLLAGLAGELGFLFILNGSPEAAVEAGAGGVHLGSRTVGPAEARAFLDAHRGPGELRFLIGCSIHYPFENHLAAIASCDYITYSPVFSTSSKKGAKPLGVDELRRAVDSLRQPVVALGGIAAGEARVLARAGCRGVAVISSVFGSGDPRQNARLLRRAFEEIEKTGEKRI